MIKAMDNAVAINGSTEQLMKEFAGVVMTMRKVCPDDILKEFCELVIGIDKNTVESIQIDFGGLLRHDKN
jgi:hypothetical protein